jgi:hypothetical protein
MSGGSVDTKALLQELKTNRRTQAAVAGFVLVLGWMVWMLGGSDAPRRGASESTAVSGSLDPRQVQALKKLPDLAALDKAGELPPAPKLVRDLFVFDAPKPPPPPVKPPPPPPPPTPEQLEQQRVAQDKQSELAMVNGSLRYIGFLQGSPAGTVGAFMKGEEPVTLPVGGTYLGDWKLVSVTDLAAQFQNTKYADLTATLNATDSSAAPVANNF